MTYFTEYLKSHGLTVNRYGRLKKEYRNILVTDYLKQKELSREDDQQQQALEEKQHWTPPTCIICNSELSPQDDEHFCKTHYPGKR